RALVKRRLLFAVPADSCKSWPSESADKKMAGRQKMFGEPTVYPTVTASYFRPVSAERGQRAFPKNCLACYNNHRDDSSFARNERMASAFARCRGFLNYHPLAKWLSIVSAVGTAILYVGLIVLLGFFIDLMVDRGEIPAYHQLPTGVRQRFLESMV